MKNGFQQQDDLFIPNVSVNKYRHTSGLLHFNIKPNNEPLIENEQYSAVFFIQTPSHDDSGLAHAAEHLSFRRSKGHPQASTLFQLTSLTDVKINASTLDGFTCFHCVCPDKTSFELVINYLIEGILSPVTTEEELTQEIFDGNQSGVIYRELLGYQANPHYLEYIQVLIGDNSPHKIHWYGGITDCLHQLTLGAITHYHQSYYQASNIQLITMTPDLDELQVLLTRSIANHSSDTSTENDAQRGNNNTPTKVENKASQTLKHIPNSQHRVYTWWIDVGYYNHINAIAQDLSTLITQTDGKMVPISCDTNAQHQFAIRVISCQQCIVQIQNLIIAHLSSHTVKCSIPDHSNSKYPQQINQIIQLYNHYIEPQRQNDNGNFLEQLSTKPLISDVGEIAPNVKQKPLKNAHLKSIVLQHESLMIKQLLAALNRTELTADRMDIWSHFIIIELQQGINTPILADIVKVQYQLEAISLANLVLINNSNLQISPNSLAELSKVITEDLRCHLPNLPQVLHQLHHQLETVHNPKRQVDSSYKLMTSDKLKENEHSAAFNVNVTMKLHAYCEQHWICRIFIQDEKLVTAWLASYVIGASSHFLHPRLSGACYSITSVYCDDVNELIFYSVFDTDTGSRMKTLSHSLKLIANDIDFLNDALTLAKHKLRRVYLGKYGRFDAEHLIQLSQLTQDIYDQMKFESLLSNISSKTLANFLRNLLD